MEVIQATAAYENRLLNHTQVEAIQLLDIRRITRTFGVRQRS